MRVSYGKCARVRRAFRAPSYGKNGGFDAPLACTECGGDGRVVVSVRDVYRVTRILGAATGRFQT